jgi:hypothetical protein
MLSYLSRFKCAYSSAIAVVQTPPMLWSLQVIGEPVESLWEVLLENSSFIRFGTYSRPQKICITRIWQFNDWPPESLSPGDFHRHFGHRDGIEGITRGHECYVLVETFVVLLDYPDFGHLQIGAVHLVRPVPVATKKVGKLKVDTREWTNLVMNTIEACRCSTVSQDGNVKCCVRFWDFEKKVGKAEREPPWIILWCA